MAEPSNEELSGGAALEAARRDKLQAIRALGIDPWGQRFDGHLPIGQIRARENEIVVAAGGRRRADEVAPAARSAGSAPPAASCCSVGRASSSFSTSATGPARSS